MIDGASCNDWRCLSGVCLYVIVAAEETMMVHCDYHNRWTCLPCFFILISQPDPNDWWDADCRAQGDGLWCSPGISSNPVPKRVLASRDDAGTSALLPGPLLLWKVRAHRRDPGWKETDNGRQGACARDGEMSCRRCDTALASDRQVHHRRPHGAPASSMSSTCWPSGTSSTDSLSCAYPMPSRCWRYAIGVLGCLIYK